MDRDGGGLRAGRDADFSVKICAGVPGLSAGLTVWSDSAYMRITYCFQLLKKYQSSRFAPSVCRTH